MIKQKKESKSVLVEYDEIFEGLKIASRKKNDEITSLLYNLFIDLDQPDVVINDKKYVGLKSESRIIKFLTKELVSIDRVKDAYVRACYEFNHEMKGVLFKYLSTMTGNAMMGKDNSYIQEEIKNDEEVYNYIMKYTTYNDYIAHKKKNLEKIKKLEK